MSAILNGLALTAGTLVMSAALPRVRDILRDPARAASESLSRNALIVAGNLLWVVYAILSALPVIGLMCGIAAGLNAIILVTCAQARRYDRTDT